MRHSCNSRNYKTDQRKCTLVYLKNMKMKFNRKEKSVKKSTKPKAENL